VKKSIRLTIDFAKLGFQVTPFFIGGNNIPREVLLVVLYPVLAGAEAGTPISCNTAYGLTLNQADAPFRVILALSLECIVGCGHTYASGSDYD
jgi:hypothetical protein